MKTATHTEVPNKNCRVYHFRSETTEQLANLAAGTTGVSHAYHFAAGAARYSLDVYKGEAFAWGEVEAELEVVFDAFNQGMLP